MKNYFRLSAILAFLLLPGEISAQVTISGTVTAYGFPLQDVSMTGLPGAPLTDSSGYYSDTVASGWSGTVTPQKAGYTFTPVSRTYASVTADQTGQDYTAVSTNELPAIERAALIALYNSTNGGSWSNNSGWKTPPLHIDGFALPGTEATWSGVTVSVGRVTTINLSYNNLTGTIPAEIGNLGGLQILDLQGNQLTGVIPEEMGSLSNLSQLILTYNQLTGSIPASFGSLDNLGYLVSYDNQLSGSIPPELGSMANLQNLNFGKNQLSGSIPKELGNLSHLTIMSFTDNQLSGSLPVELGSLTQLQGLYLQNNRLSGNIPPELGNMINLRWLRLDCNMFQGAIPASLANLTLLSVFYIGFNALYSTDPDLTAFLESKQAGWASSQTIAPANVTATGLNSTTIRLSWDAIPYSGNTGGYRVFTATAPGGPYTFYAQTLDKYVTSMDVNGLTPLTDYYFVVQTRTDAHGAQQSTLDSEPSAEASAATLSMHTVTFVAGSHGTLSGETTQVVEYGADCSPVTAVPEAGYEFANWTGGVASTDNPLTVTNVISDMTITANFALPSHAVSGAVACGGIPLAGVIMNGLPGNPATDGAGAYSAVVPYGWSGTVTPSKVGYTFSPQDRVYDSVTADQAGQDYAATLNRYTIIFLTLFEDSPLAGVTLNGLHGAPVTDGSGMYSASVDHGWSGTVTPSLPPFSFTPSFADFVNVTAGSVQGFTATLAQPLVVTSPAAGALWERGRAYSIKWLKQGAMNANVKILLYKGTSTLIKTIIASTANDGQYDWLVPAAQALATNYFIRVKTVDNLVSDDSDKFSIIEPTITVTAPTTGTVWVKEAVKTITWAKQGTQDANVKIQLFKGLTKKLDISASTPNNGSFDWTIPSTLVNGSNYVVKVITLDGKVTGKSKAFAIATGLIRVTSPATGAKLIRGTSMAINWTTEGTVNANVKIQLFKGTTKVADISASTPTANGTINWTIPAAQSLATTYNVKITALDNLISGKTGSFSILAGIITVTAPAAGAVWQRGLPHIITWTKEGDAINASVKIQLFKGTTLVSTLASATANDESFEWTIPAGQALSSNYKVRVATVDALVKADSGRFTISADAGLALIAPNGDESLRAGESYAIRWTDDPNVLEVKLEFSRDNGGTYTDIADHVEDTGQYEWQVPVNFTKNGIVRVSDANGRPWREEGVLECSLRFLYGGAGDEPGLELWFGSQDAKAPSYGFGKVSIAGSRVMFAGLARAVEPLAGSWHELRVRLDLRRDAAGIWLDEEALFENAALGTTRECYFEPGLALAAGGEQGLEMELDDLAVRVVRQDELGRDRQAFAVLRDDFERYDARLNPLNSCWQLSAAPDDGNTVELSLDAPENKSLRLRTGAGRQLLLRLPYSLPVATPFDVADEPFTVAQ